MKTIKEHFDDLPAYVREKALKNTPVLSLEKTESTLFYALRSAFNWHDTNEGFAFWSVAAKAEAFNPFGYNLNLLAAEIFQANVDKGFYDKPREDGTSLMLIVSELGEAMEAHRKGRFVASRALAELPPVDHHMYTKQFEHSVKDTYEDEIADTLIRILDHCGALGIDIQRHVDAKLAYNRTREAKHGKEY